MRWRSCVSIGAQTDPIPEILRNKLDHHDKGTQGRIDIGTHYDMGEPVDLRALAFLVQKSSVTPSVALVNQSARSTGKRRLPLHLCDDEDSNDSSFSPLPAKRDCPNYVGDSGPSRKTCSHDQSH